MSRRTGATWSDPASVKIHTNHKNITTKNNADGNTHRPADNHHDPAIFYFSSMRPEAGAGKLDVYRVHLSRAP